MNEIQCYILISNVISLKLKNYILETYMQRKQSNKKEQKNHLTNKIHMNQTMEVTASILLFC